MGPERHQLHVNASLLQVIHIKQLQSNASTRTSQVGGKGERRGGDEGGEDEGGGGRERVGGGREEVGGRG